MRVSNRSRLALLLAVAVGAVAFMVWNSSRDTAVRTPAEIEDYVFWQAKALADFTLTGAGNRTLGSGDLKGKWTFVFFGYTYCPDVCPLALTVLGQAFRMLEKDPEISREIQAVFVSVDPGRDTPDALGEYVAYFHGRFLGATGSVAQIDAFSRQMGALYTIHAKAPGKPDNAYLVTHNSTIFLVDPQGRLHGRFPAPHVPQEIAEVFLKIRALHRERSGMRWSLQ